MARANNLMRLLNFLVDAFVSGMGITQPRPEQRRLVSMVLGGFLFAVGVGAIALISLMVWRMRGT